MRILLSALGTSIAFIHGLHATPALGDSPISEERVQFAAGGTSTVLEGQLEGDAIVDYLVRAGASQTLKVTFERTNPQNYYNVLPPGSTGEAMFTGSFGGDFAGLLPADGDYRVRVYLMRAAARRGESSAYTLGIAVTGKALAPLAASQDALVPGTPNHAVGSITCVPYLEQEPRRCEASVIRRGHDGTATIEVAGTIRRSILFVGGTPVASSAQSATEPLTFERRGDTTVVRLGAEERYEIPDALVSGG